MSIPLQIKSVPQPYDRCKPTPGNASYKCDSYVNTANTHILIGSQNVYLTEKAVRAPTAPSKKVTEYLPGANFSIPSYSNRTFRLP